MKYLKVASVLAGFLLAAGMGSANLLDSFGVVSGEASVEGPTFYVASDERLVEGQNFDSEDEFTYSTLDKETLDYYSKGDLPESDWYPMELSYYIDAGVDLEESEQDFAQVEMTLRGKEGGNSYKICSQDVNVTAPADDKEVFSDSCEGELDEAVDEFELELNLLTDDTEIQYVGTGNSRVEVNAQE